MKIEQKIINQIINSTLPFKKLNNKKILITGCNGFIASSFIKFVSDAMSMKGYKIYFYGLINKKKSNKGLKSLISKKILLIKNVELDKEINLNFKPDICFHLASITSPSQYKTKPIKTLTTNILGTINLLNFCVKKKVKKFIFLSSGEIYGDFKNLNLKNKFFDENNYGIINPNNISSNYSLSKKLSENALLCWSKQHKINTNSIRLFHTYGPNMKLGDGRIHSDLVDRVSKNKDIIIKGNPNIKRSFCYISDVIIGILTVLLKGKNNNSYNVANPREIYKVKELSKIILSLKKNKKLKIKYKSKKNKRLDFIYPTPSIKKIKRLGWKPKIGVKEGFKDTLSFYNKNIGNV